MNWLDFVFLGILGISIVISLFRGLTKEILSLLIWAGAFWVAYTFVDVGANALSNVVELPSARHLIAFVSIFIVALIIGGMINYIVGKLIKKTGLSGTDRFLGMFFGALRGLIAIIAITFFVQATPLSEDPWWNESKLVPHFSKITEWARMKMPENFSNYFSFTELSKTDQLDELVKDIAEKAQQEIKQKQADEDK